MLYVFFAFQLSTVGFSDFTAYFFPDDGLREPTGQCSVIRKDPPKLKKNGSARGLTEKTYLGSLQLAFAHENHLGVDAYVHYFSKKQDCESALLRTRKLNQTAARSKQEL